MGYIKEVDAVLQALADPNRRIMREAGLVEDHPDAQWRVYRLRVEPLAELDAWLGSYRELWQQRLDALHTEVNRGNRERRSRR